MASSGVDRAIMTKVGLRIIPLMVLSYLVNYLDRVNVGFAALTMNPDLGLSATAFGWGSGFFFLTYFLLELPSNLLMRRFGPRRWLARIMMSWGLVSAAAAFVQGPIGFYVTRALLGAAEAGFFPASVFYLMYWFPAAYRSRMTALFMLAIPVSSLVGAPMSAWILSHQDVLGLRGWQWLFIVEGLPACVLGLAVLLLMPDTPQNVRWLDEGERSRLLALLAEDEQGARHTTALLPALLDPKVMLLALVQMGLTVGSYGVALWLPQILSQHDMSLNAVGVLSSLPYLASAVAMLVWASLADRGASRTPHLVAACLLGGAGLVLSALTGNLWVGLVGITISTVGNIAARPIFWPIPTAFLSGTAAAGGIALINSMGNLGGFVGPFVVGWIKDRTGSFDGGLIAMASALFVAMAASAAIGGMLRTGVTLPGSIVPSRR